MADEGFEILATRVLAGEVSVAERAQFEAWLRRDDGLRAEFAELEAAWTVMRDLARAARLDTASAGPFPEHRRHELRTAVAEAVREKARPARSPVGWQSLAVAWLGRAAWPLAAIGLCVIAVAVVWLRGQRASEGGAGEPAAYLVGADGGVGVNAMAAAGAPITLSPRDRLRLAAGGRAAVMTPEGLVTLEGPRVVRVADLDVPTASSGSSVSVAQAGLPEGLRAVLFGLPGQMFAMALPGGSRDAQPIAVYAPREATATLTPVLWWRAESGCSYEVEVRDELEASIDPWRARGVTPPLRLGEGAPWPGRPLAPNGLYRLTIRDAQNPRLATSLTFRTLEAPDDPPAATPGDGILRACRCVTRRPAAPGDALAELLALPSEAGDSELVWRLKVYLFGRLGLRDEYEAARRRWQAEVGGSGGAVPAE